jgi:hypothetical protein
MVIPPVEASTAATAQATCGAAIDVPLFHPYPQLFVVELIFTQGAEISTLLPKLENEALLYEESSAHTVNAFIHHPGLNPFTSILLFHAAMTLIVPLVLA